MNKMNFLHLSSALSHVLFLNIALVQGLGEV